MMKLLVYILFLLSVAFASVGIVLSIRLRNRLKTDSVSSLMYFQAFIYTFGFYGIWGQIVIRTFLSDFVSSESITLFSDLSLLLGLPFIVVSWMMLLKFSLEISGRKTKNGFIVFFLILNFLLIIGLGYIVSGNSSLLPKNLERYYYIILSLFYTTVASITILLPSWKNQSLLKQEKRIISGITLLLVFLQVVSLYFYDDVEWVGLVFIFIFFAGNSFLPVYLSYGTSLSHSGSITNLETGSEKILIDDLCKKYDISPRESEIIREICNGLSNKEISEKLFISLQTVKDHTHRIYIKTNLRSRSQLMNMIKNIK